MKIGINGLSLMKDLNKDFHKTAAFLRDGGCNYIEPLSDWCADPKMLEFYANLSGERTNWDPENAAKRITILKEYGIGVIGMFVFTDFIEEQAQQLGGVVLGSSDTITFAATIGPGAEELGITEKRVKQMFYALDLALYTEEE